MDIDQFRSTLHDSKLPELPNAWLRALWLDAKGDWVAAHDEIQDLPDRNSAWIHAYLHRKEGDIFNADYWYRRAGKTRPKSGLTEEWEDILGTMIMG
jgi:hypothetical protein